MADQQEDTDTRPYRWQNRAGAEVPVPLPKRWVLVPIPWVRDLLVIFAGLGLLGLNAYTWFKRSEVSGELLAAAVGLLGLPAILRIDERRSR